MLSLQDAFLLGSSAPVKILQLETRNEASVRVGVYLLAAFPKTFLKLCESSSCSTWR